MVKGLHPRDIRSTCMLAFAQEVTKVGIRFVDAMLAIIFINSFGIGLASFSFSVFHSSLYVSSTLHSQFTAHQPLYFGLVRGDLSLHWDIRSLCAHPISLRVQSLRSTKELEYSRTLRMLYTNAANIVAIDRCQLPASQCAVCTCASGPPPRQSYRQCN